MSGPLPLPFKRGLSREEAAEYVGVSPGTLDKLVAAGRLPAPWRAGARTIFDLRALNLAMDRESGLTGAAGNPDDSGVWDSVL